MAKKNSEDKGRGLVTIPSNKSVMMLDETLNTGGNMPKLTMLKERRRVKGRDYGVEYVDPEEGTNMEKKKLKVWSTNNKGEVILEYEDITALTRNNAGRKKVVFFVLMEINKELHKGIYTGNVWEVTFPLRRLVEYGIYESIRTARQNLPIALRVLQTTLVTGRIKRTTNRLSRAESNIIISHEISNSMCTVTLNPKFDYTQIATQYMMVPALAFSLSNKAFELMIYTCYLMRQRETNIKNDGSFTVSIQAIQTQLCLPDVDETREPKKLILGPIEEAIEEILEAQANEEEQYIDFKILYDANLPVRDIVQDTKKGIIEIRALNSLKRHCIHRAECLEFKKKKDEPESTGK